MHYLVSTLSCFSTLYLDGNHGLVHVLADRGSTILKRTSTQAGLLLYGDVCYLAYAR